MGKVLFGNTGPREIQARFARSYLQQTVEILRNRMFQHHGCGDYNPAIVFYL